MPDNTNPLVCLGGLWTHKDKNGVPFLAGTLGSARVVILKNMRKKGDKEPDFRLLVCERRRDNDKQSGDSAAGTASETQGADMPF